MDLKEKTTMKNKKVLWFGLGLIIPFLIAAQTYIGSWQIDHQNSLTGINSPAGALLEDIIDSLGQGFEAPLRITQSVPADAKLTISANLVEGADQGGISSSPADGVLNSFVLSTIDFQTGTTTGGTIQRDG